MKKKPSKFNTEETQAINQPLTEIFDLNAFTPSSEPTDTLAAYVSLTRMQLTLVN